MMIALETDAPRFAMRLICVQTPRISAARFQFRNLPTWRVDIVDDDRVRLAGNARLADGRRIARARLTDAVAERARNARRRRAVTRIDENFARLRHVS